MRQRRFSLGVPELSAALVLLMLIAGGLLLGGSSSSADAERTVVAPERLTRVEREVEQIRGLDFKRPVSVEVMTPEEVRAYAARLSSSRRAQQQVETSGELMKLLGMIEPDVDFAAVTSDIYGEQVAGFYDPETERLVLVEDVGIDDATLAHELTHALDDQHFDLERLGSDPDSGPVYDGDGDVAESGLVEGTAMVVMTRYLERNPDAISLGDAFGQLLTAAGGRPLPESVMRGLLFPYTAGEQFASRLYETTGDWRLLDNALAHRSPAASADLLDPQRWLRVVRPVVVAVPPADAPGAGWRRLMESTYGQADLQELFHEPLGQRRAARAAAAWRGGTVALWRRGPLPDADCAAPCRANDAVALRIRTDSPAATRRLARLLDDWLWELPDVDWVTPGGDVLRIGQDGLAQITVDGREVRVAMAPDAQVLEAMLG